jgi:sigma-E factor negative regulatory protein RseC
MATEKGIVTRVGSATAWVKTSRTSACEGCASRQSCHLKGDDDAEMEVEAFNDARAVVGDRIVLRVASGALLKVSFMLYVFPILLLILGAIVGQILGPAFHYDSSSFSLLLGGVCFGLAFILIRLRSGRMARKTEYRPRIVRVLK